ncbi:MAG: prepilin-type N-terminal cleavage/methylation domain-containing protein [Verrucomicrobia bacterium]|jgi:prepilin-type N-terminal cleavage/methylation domain-containing protein|nr:prepilin-type N-terminal cleavage/methylation domain-containing protein [Verrucomicrobiota bacterium]
MRKNERQRRNLSGFTLVELLITLAIVGFVMVGVTKLMMDITRTSFITSEKLDINADVRQFTLEMADNARAANHFFIYKSMSSSDRDEPGDRQRDSKSGDLLLLVFQEPWPNVNSPDHYTRLVGYFRYPDGNTNVGPVYRFEKRFHDPTLTVTPPGSSGPFVSTIDHTPEELIEDVPPTGTYPTVVQLSRGLANGKLFFNYLERTIMIKAEIIHGNEAKWITDTYNYAVSPRG